MEPREWVIELSAPTPARETALEQLERLATAQPLDFVFDLTGGRLALAVGFEGHPALAARLAEHAGDQAALVGGRLGRTRDGRLASSEWSGHFGATWNDATRAAFAAAMRAAGLELLHYPWHPGQAANDFG